MRIALYQAQTGIDPAENGRDLVGAIEGAAAGGAAMLFTPEMSGLLDRDRTRAMRHLHFEGDDPVLAAVREAAAKAGLQGFTKTLALELGRFGVTANAVAPGFIATDMTAATAARVGMSFDEFKNSVAQDTAVGRVGVPDDVAHAVSYFCSDGAGFVTGQVLYVAGTPLG